MNLKKVKEINFKGLFFVIMVFLIFNYIFIERNKKLNRELKDLKFTGRIENLRFSEKEQPLVTINNKEYYLDIYSPYFNNYIIINDSLHKDSGDYRITVIRTVNNKKVSMVFDKY